jgi:hypothetical protein
MMDVQVVATTTAEPIPDRRSGFKAMMSTGTEIIKKARGAADLFENKHWPHTHRTLGRPRLQLAGLKYQSDLISCLPGARWVLEI